MGRVARRLWADGLGWTSRRYIFMTMALFASLLLLRTSKYEEGLDVPRELRSVNSDGFV